MMFKGSKYAKRLPIGDTTIFMHCPPDNLRRFYHDWYRTDLEGVVVVGDFDAKKVAEQVKTLFSKIPVKENPRPAVTPDIPDNNEPLVKVATDKEQPYNLVQLFYKHPMKSIKSYADYREYIKAQLLSAVINQRFQDEIKKADAPFAYAASSYDHLIGKEDNFGIIAVTKNGKMKDAVNAIFSEMENIRQNGINQSELDLQKKTLLKKVEKMYNERDKQKSKSLAFELKSNFDITQSAVPGMALEYKLYQTFLPTIGLKEITALINNWITDKNIVLTISANEKNKATLPTETELITLIKNIKSQKFEAKKETKLDKDLLASAPTKLGKIKSTSTDKTLGSTKFVMKNGATIIIKPTDFKDDEIKMTAYSWGGTSLYPLSKNITARKAADIVNSSGLGQYNNIEMSKFLSVKNVKVSPFINLYSQGFKGNSSKEDFETMLQIVYAYFTAPRNDKEAFDAYINQTKAFLENKVSNPISVWQDTLRMALANYSPYTKPISAADLSKIDYNQVLPIFKERFANPSNFTFVFVGNIHANKAKDLLAKYIGSIKGKKKADSYKDLGIRYPQTFVRKNVHAGTAPKSMVYTIYPSSFENKLNDKILIQAVADVFTDRLLNKIREKKQLTYSISASPNLSYFPVKQSFIGVFYSCAPDKIDTVNNLITAIVKNLQTKEISDDDLQKTIQKAKRSHEVNMRKNDYWANKLELLQKIDMKPEFVTDFDKDVQQLSKKSIKEAANRFLSTQKYMLIALQPLK